MLFINAQPGSHGGPAVWTSRFVQEAQKHTKIVHNLNSLKEKDSALFLIRAQNIEKLQRKQINICLRIAGLYIPDWFEIMNRPMPTEAKSYNNQTAAVAKQVHIIYQSQWAYKMFRKYANVPTENYSIIYNGVPLNQFRPNNPVKFDGENLIIGSAGALRYRFRLETLFETVKFIMNGYKTVEIRLAGTLDNECKNVLQKYKNLPIKVTKPGHLNATQLVEFYNGIHVLYHPVAGDACPNVVAECLACGTPVACPEFGGASELVQDGGIAFEAFPWAYDSSEFIGGSINAIQMILCEHNLYREKARKVAEKNLDIRNMVNKYLTALKVK